MKLGEVVKKYREDHDLSMRQFAKLSGLSHAYIPLIERGTNHNGSPLIPSITVYKQLADAMGITLHELMKMVDDDERVDISEESNRSVEDSSFPLTAHEKRLITAYRENPNLQPIIDHTLGIDSKPPEGKTLGEDMKDAAEDILESLREVQEPGSVRNSQS